MWFDGYPRLTYDSLFYYIVGARGAGKTYWAKCWAIKDFLRYGHQFIYLRRYKSELSVNSFFTQVQADFPDVNFTVKGKSFYINGTYAGEAVALSTGITKKSVSFSKVTKIIFDEFMIEEGNYRYLKNEVHAFLDFYETVNRYRTDTKEVVAMFLSNAISVMNPYFIYFGIHFKTGQYRWHKNEIYAEIIAADEFINAKSKTRFGRLIKDTEYGAYSMHNNFYLDDKRLIEKKTGQCNYYCTFVIEDKEYGVWVNYELGKMYISTDVDKYCGKRFCFSTKDHGYNTMLLSGSIRSAILGGFIKNYRLGNVKYESLPVKSAVQDIVKILVGRGA